MSFEAKNRAPELKEVIQDLESRVSSLQRVACDPELTQRTNLDSSNLSILLSRHLAIRSFASKAAPDIA